MTEDKMVGWHYQLNGHEFEQAPQVGHGQGSLVCCSPWGHKDLDMTERLNITDPQDIYIQIPRTCGYVPLHGKSDFAHVIKSWLLGWRDYFGLSSGAQCSYKSLKKQEDSLESE